MQIVSACVFSKLTSSLKRCVEVSLSTPFELLAAIDRKSRARAQGLPSVAPSRKQWLGIGFRLRDNHLVVPLRAVAEIVTPLDIAAVPGVKPWVLGIASMRGNLLPVIDLQALLFGHAAVADPRARRVLVVEHGGHSTGLMVDGVAGLRRFWADERSEDLPSLAPELRTYVTHAYPGVEHRYALLDLVALLKSEAFNEVAA